MKTRTLVRDIEIPILAQPMRTSSSNSKNLHLPATFYVTWPDGRACHILNMYLIDMAISVTVRSDDGGTLKHISSDLTHLVRFCWENDLQFDSLTDADFRMLVSQLLSSDSLPTSKRPRDNNTVRRIIMRTLHFLSWVQHHFMLKRTLVGPSNSGAQVGLSMKPSDYLRTSSKLVYPYLPPKDINDPKKPMPTELRNHLVRAVHRLYQNQVENARWTNSPLARLQNDFLLIRRQLLLRLLESTGCRPGELRELSVSKNRKKLEACKLILPTLKRRKARLVERLIPLDDSTAIKFSAYLDLREKFMAALQRSERSSHPNDCVFISVKDAAPLRVSSLETEFKRIRFEAHATEGMVGDYRACMSMFRHRFITKMVAIYLSEFLRDNPLKNRFSIGDSDYRSILTRVKVLTGHARVESLFPYLDAAWEELGVFNGADATADALRALEAGRADLEDAQLLMPTNSTPESLEAVESAKNALASLHARLDKILIGTRTKQFSR